MLSYPPIPTANVDKLPTTPAENISHSIRAGTVLSRVITSSVFLVGEGGTQSVNAPKCFGATVRNILRVAGLCVCSTSETVIHTVVARMRTHVLRIAASAQ